MNLQEQIENYKDEITYLKKQNENYKNENIRYMYKIYQLEEKLELQNKRILTTLTSNEKIQEYRKNKLLNSQELQLVKQLQKQINEQEKQQQQKNKIVHKLQVKLKQKENEVDNIKNILIKEQEKNRTLRKQLKQSWEVAPKHSKSLTPTPTLTRVGLLGHSKWSKTLPS
jgi:hypothetical protein